MITGGCLCGAVRFEVERLEGSFELCHCSRCRKASGAAFVAGIGVRARDFCWVAGEGLVRRYEAPVREHPHALPGLTKQELIELRIAAYRAKANKRRGPE